MRRALLLTSVLLAACAASGGAMAQSTNSEGLRYLSWPGKPPAAHTAVQPGREAAPQPTRIAATPSQSPIPLARLAAPTPAPAATHNNGLTPASAFYTPQPRPTPVPAEVAPATSQPYAAAPAPTPAPRPASAPVHAPAPLPVAVQPEPAPAEVAADPMAPRRDAPIFRLQRQAAVEPAPAPEPTAEEASAKPQQRTEASAQVPAQPPAMTQAALAPVQGARFYSVHRQAGRQPDAINTPQPIYLDALPVQLTQTPSSADLAQPDGPPALLRNSNGTVRAMPQTQADDLP